MVGVLLVTACGTSAAVEIGPVVGSTDVGPPVDPSPGTVPVVWMSSPGSTGEVVLVEGSEPVDGSEDRTRRAVRTLFEGSADPGLGSPWALSGGPADLLSVTVNPQLVVVDVAAAVTVPPSAVSLVREVCELAVPQLVATVAAATGTRTPVEILVDGRRGRPVWCDVADHPFVPETQGDST